MPSRATNVDASTIAMVVVAVVCGGGGSCASSGSQADADAVSPNAAAQEGVCESFPTSVQETKIDLAPPGGFTETCSKDVALCRDLTAGYPQGVITLGYFFASAEWAARLRGERVVPSRYLIAQASSLTDGEFPALQTFIRERDGAIADHSTLPRSLGPMEKFNLGVVDEDVDSISSAVLMKSRSSSVLPSPEMQVAINMAVLTRGRVLSLYVHHRFSDRRDIDRAKQLAKSWLACLRKGSR